MAFCLAAINRLLTSDYRPLTSRADGREEPGLFLPDARASQCGYRSKKGDRALELRSPVPLPGGGQPSLPVAWGGQIWHAGDERDEEKFPCDAD